jgi:hypothetical protein
MAREDTHFRLRLPEDLKEQIRKSAEVSGRSMTAEIVHRLGQSYSQELDFDLHEALSAMERELERHESAINELREEVLLLRRR